MSTGKHLSMSLEELRTRLRHWYAEWVHAHDQRDSVRMEECSRQIDSLKVEIERMEKLAK